MAISRPGTTASRSLGGAGSPTGWFPVARSAEVQTTPVPVGAAGRAYVVVRLRPGAEVTALSARCPHRLVPLATATVVDGRLQCPSHGWQFDAEGRCVAIPSLGVDGTPPPRADLSAPWAVEERDGWVWLAPERTPLARPPRLAGRTPTLEPVPAPPAPDGPVFGNLDPALEHAWHPVARAGELVEGGWVQVRLLGRTWTLHRRDGVPDADPPAWGVLERHGLVWIAPAEPRDELLDVPETTDARFTAVWLTPARSTAPAGLLADAFLDGARGRRPPGAEPQESPEYAVSPEPGGFSGALEQRAVDSAVARRRVTYRYRAPFQLLRREEPDSGAVRTTLFLLQPEDADSTRVHTCLLLHGLGGAAVVPADVVAAERAAEEAVLAEDLARQARTESAGLPLQLRDELHLRADRLGVALRRALADLAANAAVADRAAGLQRRASA
ncbi:Rieske 2Fe-2S domain-containing protein [Modestobacter altitudinis]|uniref:Rieske 2Fe-2S domain-containing protein n=1 Tax=Modestobacter altitudinis TaxID=2213158 RepID=UPI00110D18AC|nr:Rieske 2Fe-2S domain-containing protein [Modestobacter altitudinis]